MADVADRLRALADAAEWKGIGDPVDPAIAANERLRGMAPDLVRGYADALDALELLSNPDGVVRAGDMTFTRIPPTEIAGRVLAEAGRLLGDT